MYDLGYRIKEVRTQRGMAQNELAKRISKSKSAVCGYENEAQVPPLDVLVSIASVLNVSLDYLVGFEKEESVSVKDLAYKQKRLDSFHETQCLKQNTLYYTEGYLLGALAFHAAG